MAAVNTATIQSSSESHSVGAGVTIGLGKQTGISFQLNASQSNGNANGSETSFDNTLVTATNTLTVKSGGNTNLMGAQLAGNTVKMDVGGHLNIVTLQDKSDFASEQHSSGFGISLCLPPLCVGGAPVTGSINKNDASINHNYQSAKGQSGIAAGGGGYDITVNGNTHLAGGAITSTAPQDQNTLKTGSLTSTDVNNSQTTSSQSTSLSLGYSGGSGTSTLLTNARTNALANLANLNGGAGMPANGSQSGTTQSVISLGNVTVTGTGNAATDANSTTQVASLTSRDASKANGALTNTLTLQQAQQIPADQQKAAENAQIAQLIAPVVFNAVGDIAQKNDWAESSPQKIALHAVAGYIVASAGGGNGNTGAVAAAANEATTSSISSIVDKAMPIPAGATPAQARQIEADRNVVKETASTLVGIGAVAATGGTNQQMATGGNIALAADQYNRQLHQTEKDRIKALASGDPQREARLLAAACSMVRCADGVPKDDPAYKYLESMQDWGATLTDERSLLSIQTGQVNRNPHYPLFGYTGVDEYILDPLSQNKVGTRSGGLLQAVGGAVLIAGGTAECTTGLGCVLGAGSIVVGADNLKAGATTAVTGNATHTEGEKVLMSLGLSPQAAAYTYAALGMTPAVVAGANGALNAMGKTWEAGKVLGAGEVALSNGGNISAQQITRVGTPAALSEADMARLSTLNTLDRTEAAVLRETVSDTYFRNIGFRSLDGKCGVNCFDGVYVSGNQVIVNEVKPLNANGSIQLNPSQPSGLPTQGTIQWVLDRANFLSGSSDPVLKQTGQTILDAYRNGNLTTLVSGVNSNGMVVVRVKP